MSESISELSNGVTIGNIEYIMGIDRKLSSGQISLYNGTDRSMNS